MRRLLFWVGAALAVALLAALAMLAVDAGAGAGTRAGSAVRGAGAGAGGPSTVGSPTRPAADPPVDPNVDYADPTTVCLHFATAIHRHDTRTDAGPSTAYRHAMAYATTELVTALALHPDRQSPQWIIWRVHRASTDPIATVGVDEGDVQPADTAGMAYRMADVRFTPVGVDGWRGPTEHRLVFCTLRRNLDGWRVERYQINGARGVNE